MKLHDDQIKKIRGLILFTGVVVLVLVKFDLLLSALQLLIGMLSPFIMGGAMAFILNLPMRFYEQKLFAKVPATEKKQKLQKKCKRPVSMMLSFLTVVLIIAIVMGTVIPQLIATGKVLAQEIPVFIDNVVAMFQNFIAKYPDLQSELEAFELPKVNWSSLLTNIGNFLKNGAGNLATTTFSVAGSIISGAVNFFIALIFAFYILAQKEKLGDQCERVLRAYTKPGVYRFTRKVASLLYQNFSNFISGQCLEAVILGAMFVVTMTIFRFPFALMIGVLIAFTALIPIVGAFLGCVIGAFLILVDDPMKAVAFVILFLVLQQIEGNLIYPHVVGSSVGLPSIWVLVAVTIGGSLMGVVGILVFIPLLSTVYALVREDVNRRNGCAATREAEDAKASAETGEDSSGKRNQRKKND